MNVKTEYLWMLKPVSKKSRKIREKAKKKDAKIAGIGR